MNMLSRALSKGHCENSNLSFDVPLIFTHGLRKSMSDLWAANYVQGSLVSWRSPILSGTTGSEAGELLGNKVNWRTR